MARLMLEPYNLLVLDEPTNHMDMRSKDILKNALQKYNGTVIVVSHDRDFLDGLVTKVYEFGNKKVTEHLCGIYEFVSQIICKNDTVQVFATACGIILTGFLAEIVYNYLILVIK